MNVDYYATIPAVLTISSALVRFVETRRSKDLGGLADGYIWLGFLSNVGWLSYGLARNVEAQIWASSVWLAVFAYLIARRWKLGANKYAWISVAVSAAIIAASARNGDWAGWIAGTVGTLSAAPQAWQVWTSKNTHGVGPIAWSVSTFMGFTWTVYGLHANLIPVASTNSAYVLLGLSVLTGYARAKRQNKMGESRE